MISGYVIGDKEVARHLRSISDLTRTKLTRSIGNLMLKLQVKVMKDKLSGQVLKVRTGTLRRSIPGCSLVISDDNAISAVVGTNLKYGKMHEYGSQETVTVKEHLRLVKKAWGKDLKTPVLATVKAHPMKLNMPERSFLRSALKDMREEIVRDIDKAVGEGVKQ